GNSCKENADCQGELLCAGGSCVPAPSCSTNTDCPRGMKCDQTMHLCRAPICLKDSDCLGGQVCFFGECRDKVPGCRYGDCPKGAYCSIEHYECEYYNCTSDEQCAGDRHCHNTNCKDCSDDSYCPDRTTCDVVSGRCSEASPCLNDEECHRGRVCNPETKACEKPPCDPDPYVGNSSRDEALELRDGSYSFMRCEEEGSDWFVFKLDKGKGFLLHSQYSWQNSNFEFRLYKDEEDDEITRLTDSTGSGRIFVAYEGKDVSGTYYLRAKRSTREFTRYSLRFDIVEAGICRDDGYESNDTPKDAVRLTSKRVYTNKYCQGSEDWFSIDLGPKEQAELVLTIHSGMQDLYMMVIELDDEGNEKIVGQTTTKGNQIVRFDSEEGGNYYVRIFSDIATRVIYQLEYRPVENPQP
ncbi:MAG: hypothetical protein AAFX99_13450, partial [Myxococcota bacterium]